MRELDKCSIEFTMDHRSNIRNRRFQFCSSQTRMYLFTTILLVSGISVFAIIQIVLYQRSSNSFGSDPKILPQKNNDNVSQVMIENHEINPCDNFYNFACQAWEKENLKPERENKWNVFAVQYYKINKLVIDTLEEPIQDNEIYSIAQAKNLYKNCLAENVELQSNLREAVGQTGYLAINELCADSVKKIFSIALAHQIAVSKYGDSPHFENIRIKVQQMFENMRNWVINLDRRLHSNPFDQTKLCVGLPYWLFNRTRVQAEYNELYLDINQTFSHQLDAANHWLRQLIAGRKANPNFECPWTDSMGYDGAYYLRSKNLIYLPLGFLEPPYFDQNQSDSQNYGFLGSVIGHELAHAYLVPNSDNIKNSTLMCLKNQYDSLAGHESRGSSGSLNLDRTVHENLADNLGLAAAYNARFMTGVLRDMQIEKNHKWNKNSQTGEYTNEQLFFLSFAQKFCELPSKLALRQEEHSQAMIRVLGTLQNSYDFAKAWSCSIGSAMNPSPSQHQKCQFL